jgi:hypothetical protein
LKGELVVLEIFSNEAEALVARSFLEANGVTSYIFRDDPAGYFSLRVSNPSFGTRLMVRSSEMEEARKLLATMKK